MSVGGRVVRAVQGECRPPTAWTGRGYELGDGVLGGQDGRPLYYES